MEIGFNTGVFPDMALEPLFRWAEDNGFPVVELGPSHAEQIVKEGATGTAAAAKHGVEIASLFYVCRDNLLNPDARVRRRACAEFREVLTAMARLDIPVVTTYSGRPLPRDLLWPMVIGVPATKAHGDWLRPPRPLLTEEDAVERFAEAYAPLLDLAEENALRIALEITPHGGGGGGSIAYSPGMWTQLFAAVPSKALALTFDPSHLVFGFVDYLDAARRFGGRIATVHGKDAEIFREELGRVGIFGHGWWRYRLPGCGEVNWTELIRCLREGGYDHVINIEGGDVAPGAPAHRRALLLARDYLRNAVEAARRSRLPPHLQPSKA
jgi:sugar phosphate isomerase/epimerase